MTPGTLDTIKDWFLDFAERYAALDPHKDGACRLKIDHTLRVRENCRRLASAIGLTKEQTALAEATGLLHDVGRFEQFYKYRTFNDSRSTNHARLALRILGKSPLWKALDLKERRLMGRAIAFHNAAVLPRQASGLSLILMRLIRDADKIDIWKVVLDYEESSEKERNTTIELGLPDTGGFSGQVVSTLASGHFIRTADLRNLNDFRLLQIGWVFDLNFAPSFRIVQERRYIERIAALLPRDLQVDEAIKGAMAYVTQRTGRTTLQPHRQL